MNFRRGLFRAWVVFACVFIIAVAAASYGEVALEFERANALRINPPPLGFVVDRPPVPWALVMVRTIIALAVPAIVLAIGLVLGWVFSGFAKPGAKSIREDGI